ncbi:hypothetical protein ACHAXS_000145, partial [Conticribra weissflogii]
MTNGTVYLMLENLLGLTSKQANVTTAYLHATLGEYENYIKITLSLKQHGSRKVQSSLSQKTLYGLHHSLCAFWIYLTEEVGHCGLPQAPFNPCLFIGEKVIVICYIDDLFFWARNEKDAVDLSVQFYTKGFDPDQDGDAARFLGVHIEHDPNTGFLNMMQKRLIKQMLETFVLNIGTANGKITPAKGKPLAKHTHGEPGSGNFNYISVVGVFFYLAGHTCPDITYAFICAARYMFCPKIVHKDALKRIGHYLKATSDTGLIMKPSEKLLKID